ncbi:hypothetical protein [Bosea sp. RAC05]|uniref:hypothetical protein n=1 Tax=Bosea sp. RAC05 TaxID=1842539 RepID=UPI00083D25F6|nr:hypothetical protein [Bosea sp. RAC05]AOG03268.1 hypothetical protein BSY19_5144 [Bosea sp. RAC05]
MWGDADWQRRRDEDEARRARIEKEQRDKGAELDALLAKAETDVATARLVGLARILRPEDFIMREQGLARVQEMRLGPSGNDPAQIEALAAHERTARLSIEYAISKAQEVMAFIETWKDDDRT